MQTKFNMKDYFASSSRFPTSRKAHFLSSARLRHFIVISSIHVMLSQLHACGYALAIISSLWKPRSALFFNHFRSKNQRSPTVADADDRRQHRRKWSLKLQVTHKLARQAAMNSEQDDLGPLLWCMLGLPNTKSGRVAPTQNLESRCIDLATSLQRQYVEIHKKRRSSAIPHPSTPHVSASQSLPASPLAPHAAVYILQALGGAEGSDTREISYTSAEIK